MQGMVDSLRLQLPLVGTIVHEVLPTVAKQIREAEQPFDHDWALARQGALLALGKIQTREEAEAVLGPRGPQLAARDLHPTVWSAAARLWDDGHHPQAVQTAAQALEGHMQGTLDVAWSGADLAKAFATSPATPASPRLRFPGLDPGTDTWNSAHEGAASLVRGAMMGVRNLVSHSGWPRPSPAEALEQLAILSYVCRLVDCATVETVH